MTKPQEAFQFFNFPEPLETNIEYKAPPKGANPVVRGFPLALGAPLVHKLKFVSKFLYKNAGFEKLKKLDAIKDAEHRFDPTVIPLATEADRAPVNYTDPAELRDVALTGPNRYYSVKDYYEAYRSGATTPTKVVEVLFPLIRRDVKPRTSHSIAFLETQIAQVRSAAAASTARWAAGAPIGVLDGVPVAVKDEVDLKGYSKSWGTAKTFENSSPETSFCVRQWEEQGAVVVGKTNMHEIGMDTTNNNPSRGTPRNPFNIEYFTGGSSGGSGYAVGAGLVPFALGCDGGGSIRIPASYCGIYGLKPTHSRVSTTPTPNLAGTNTVSGPMAADMTSLEIAYRVMATPDPSSTHSGLFPKPRRLTKPREKVLGIFQPWFNRANPVVKDAAMEMIDYYREELGYDVIDISIPIVHEGQTAHAITIMNEGLNGFSDLHLLQPANRVLLSVAGQCSANNFLQAQRVRHLLMSHVAYLFTQHPDLIIVTPTTPNPGWSISGPADLRHGFTDGDMTTRSMEYVYLANFTGCPALTMPAGFVTPEKGKGDIPVGLMGMGVWGSEDALIEWGFEGEQYVEEVLEGGRLRSPVWVDVLGEASRLGTSASRPRMGSRTFSRASRASRTSRTSMAEAIKEESPAEEGTAESTAGKKSVVEEVSEKQGSGGPATTT